MSTKLINRADLNGVHQPLPNQWTLFGSPQKFIEMPLVDRERILFLDALSTESIYGAVNRQNLLYGDDGFGNTPFVGGCYKRVEQYRHQGKDDLKKWLYQRSVPFTATAFILPVFAAQDEPAILTTWKIIVKYAPELFSGDNIVVVGETTDWCLYYHHDGILTFAREPDMSKIYR